MDWAVGGKVQRMTQVVCVAGGEGRTSSAKKPLHHHSTTTNYINNFPSIRNEQRTD